MLLHIFAKLRAAPGSGLTPVACATPGNGTPVRWSQVRADSPEGPGLLGEKQKEHERTREKLHKLFEELLTLLLGALRRGQTFSTCVWIKPQK